MSGEVRVSFKTYQEEIIKSITKPEATESLLVAVNDSQFGRLPTSLKLIAYSHLVDRLMNEDRLIEAEEYLNKGLEIDGEKQLAYLEHLLTVRKLLFEVSKLPLTVEESGKILTYCLEIAREIQAHPDSYRSLRQPEGLNYYNQGLTLALIGDRAKAIFSLAKAYTILNQPIDRIIRAQTKCGLAFLVHHGSGTPDASLYASELSPEEKSSEFFRAEVQRWENVCRGI